MSREERRILNNRIRRARQLRRHLVLGALALCVSIAVSMAGFSFRSKAAADDQTVFYKYYTSIMVYPGDTLTSIASEYADSHYESLQDYIGEVQRMNHLRDDEIRAGEYLVVPYYSTEFR